ncbi:LysR substrate-binding domain-containing protein [Klebsiella sp. BIGb0407]|uniref:LysR substrate-binding domain-containing protein n=1 Tax=Klebsiella sp. BIGb0407 TaxID=2940603 RepID=UPI0021685A43|nr:LysR substrate-binding domain-containing protein [Klebsiella sp. BIGb0407]MCS3431669.1 DNA-binding transcriptional LysR family regulator [Klebsiella sp. BIGb0407]
MANENRLILNLDLDLLRTFVAVADLNTFGAAAIAVCRTQSAVSQQMQRLELLVEKELFVRHGRNKLLTDHGVQLLGYARKILRFNDEACLSLRASTFDGVLTLWAAAEITEAILPAQLDLIRSIYPKLVLDVRIKSNPFQDAKVSQQEVDLIVATSHPAHYESTVLRRSSTLWYCATEYIFRKGEPIPLVLLEESCLHRDMMLNTLNNAGIPWRISYEATTQASVYAALKAGLGVTAGPMEAMMCNELRMLGQSEGLPILPETKYLLCKHPETQNAMAQMLFNQLSDELNPSRYRVKDESSLSASMIG